MSVLIGVTGPIASGKSTACRHLASLGFPIIEADQLTKMVCRPGAPAVQDIADKLGALYVDDVGVLVTERLRQKAFSDAYFLADLENILHPHMRIEANKLKEKYFKTHNTVIFDCAILFKAELIDGIDRSLGIVAAEETCIRRIITRNGLSRAMAEKMLAAQTPTEMIIRLSDYCVENEGEEAPFLQQVTDVINRWTPPL